MNRTDRHEAAYPSELWKYERIHLLRRRPGRELPADRPDASVVGFGLSGGGIRSATFCLGLFQALAQLRHLPAIDYISTVSGGGYFGSFLGRLYRRREIESAEQVSALLDPTAPTSAHPPRVPDVTGWLRENGRYLSPNGAGDLLLGAAISLRNWVTIHVVLLSFALLALMTGQSVRVLEAWWPTLGLSQTSSSWIWWSPWTVAPGLTFAFGAIPAAWAFWMTGQWVGHRRVLEWPVWGVVLTAGIAILLIFYGRPLRLWHQSLSVGVGAGALVAIALTGIAWKWSLAKAKADSVKTDFRSSDSQTVFEIDRQRNLLSAWLKVALVLTGALLAFALIDSIGQTLYLVRARHGSSRIVSAMYSTLVILGGLGAFAQRIATAAGARANGGRLRLPVAALATTAALALVALLLVSLSVLTHAVVWNFGKPTGAPPITWAAMPAHTSINLVIPGTPGSAITATVAARDASTTPDVGSCCERPVRDFWFAGFVWLALLAFAILFGQCWPFINQSSLYSMYSARLTRAYLGASNPRRKGGDRERVTDVVPGDNIDPVDYWPSPPETPDPAAPPPPDPTARPLHIINVTINETVDGRSNVQQQDRKGTGLAVGPCAFSVGVGHHAVFPGHDVFRKEPTAGGTMPAEAKGKAASAKVTVFPEPSKNGDAPYRVFAIAKNEPWRAESLSIGKWTGISGAAFSTGLGSRTSLGLSLLCGLANVRLGYWWNSGIAPENRPRRGPRFLERMFSVQTYLLSEFVSRFYGTTRQQWYLSDGGHFENMGGYELIRRRLDRIVIIDAEADPDYTFEGLANLVRKARLDFGAEITFLTESEIASHVAPGHRRLFGSLEQLRRGKWAQEPVRDRLAGAPRLTVEEPVDEARHSLAHAALARIAYVDEPQREPGWFLYIKPTLVGDEPSDVTQYHREHTHFPQETTADQFFDEAQWESYRALGYHIGLEIFREGTGAAAYPTPADLVFGSNPPTNDRKAQTTPTR